MRVTGAKTRREAVESGAALLVRLKEQEDIRGLRGKLRWTGDLDRMRRDLPADGRAPGIGFGDSATSGDRPPRQP